MKPTIELNESNFDREVLQSDQPVVVDFWAEWCGPCKMLAPALDEIARDLQGRAVVAKVNVDERRTARPDHRHREQEDHRRKAGRYYK
jgi:thioredoxin